MASTDPEVAKAEPPPAKSDVRPPPVLAPGINSSVADVALRVVLFAATLVAIIVMVTSEQSVLVPQPQFALAIKISAKFKDSPAFIYFVAALTVACFYSIITTLASISVILKPAFHTKFLFYFAFWDVLILGVVASATGAAGSVAYIGLKGNNHVGWTKVCSTYDKFCRHIGSSTFVALFAAILLVLLSMLSTYSLNKRIPH